MPRVESKEAYLSEIMQLEPELVMPAIIHDLVSEVGSIRLESDFLNSQGDPTTEITQEDVDILSASIFDRTTRLMYMLHATMDYLNKNNTKPDFADQSTQK